MSVNLGTILKGGMGINPDSGGGSLQDVIASACCDLDATITDSYTTGQTWANLVAVPADGAGQTDYDFWLGEDGTTSTDDPTFTGTAGDSAAYFLADGGDFFTIKSNTALINNMHKTTGGSDFWIAMAFYLPTDATLDGMFSSNSSSTTSVGIRSLILSPAQTAFLAQQGDSAQVNAISTNTFTQSSYTIVIFSHSHSTNKTRIWMNSTTNEEFSHTFNTTTSDASDPFRFMFSPNGVEAANGFRLVNSSIGNEYLDDTKVAAIVDALNIRHNRTYA